MQNKLKSAIKEKGNAVGTFLSLATPALIENISTSGLDFVVIDTEHGTYDLKDISDMIRAAESRKLSPVIRVSEPTHREIQHALDEGAEGIIVPYLRRIEDFRKVAELGKFPPIGNRGFARGRGSCFGNEAWSAGTPEDYMAASNEKVLLIPQCETLEALENIEEIVTIEGIDGIFIGPYDLSICMGIPTQFTHPDFCSAVSRIRNACKSAGKICMIYTTTVEEARMRLESGFEAISHSLDAALYAQVYKETMESIRPGGRLGEKSCGAVVFTRENSGIRYVLVEQRSGRYCFPKGHVEAGETEHQTALREIWEETGLRPEIVEGFRETETYEVLKKPGKMKDVVYFLAEFNDQPLDPPESDEIRSVGLFTYEEAFRCLETESRRKILTAADAFLRGDGSCSR